MDVAFVESARSRPEFIEVAESITFEAAGTPVARGVLYFDSNHPQQWMGASIYVETPPGACEWCREDRHAMAETLTVQLAETVAGSNEASDRVSTQVDDFDVVASITGQCRSRLIGESQIIFLDETFLVTPAAVPLLVGERPSMTT